MPRIIGLFLALFASLTMKALAFPPDPAKAVKISDNIYMAPSAGNVYMVTTSAGNVIIDTAMPELAEQARKALLAENRGPVRYIILTHCHADHIGGIDLWKQAGTQIIAQRECVEFLNYTSRLAGFFGPRDAAQFNHPEPAHETWAGNYGAKIEATILFDQKYEFELGGVKFELYSTPGETPDHLTVWLPRSRTAFIGDNYDAAGIPGRVSFPNLSTLRGSKPRWALDYVNSLNKVLALKPDVVLPGHGQPVFGNKEITERLTRFRDAIQYVHDEVVKGMNAGKDEYTLMREIKLPPNLAMDESFGKLDWSIRGIYEGYAGWFDTNPSTMYSLPPSSIYPDLVRLAGGPDPIIRLALEKLQAGKAVEALRLTDVVLGDNPKNRAGLEARLKVLGYLLDRSDNVIEASWLEYGIRKAKEALSAQ